VIQIEKFAQTHAESSGEFLDHHTGASPRREVYKIGMRYPKFYHRSRADFSFGAQMPLQRWHASSAGCSAHAIVRCGKGGERSCGRAGMAVDSRAQFSLTMP
jgi:hypothetical protein